MTSTQFHDASHLESGSALLGATLFFDVTPWHRRPHGAPAATQTNHRSRPVHPFFFFFYLSATSNNILSSSPPGLSSQNAFGLANQQQQRQISSPRTSELYRGKVSTFSSCGAQAQLEPHLSPCER